MHETEKWNPENRREICPCCGGTVHPVAGKCRHCRVDLSAYRAHSRLATHVPEKKTPAIWPVFGAFVLAVVSIVVLSVLAGVVMVSFTKDMFWVLVVGVLLTSGVLCGFGLACAGEESETDSDLMSGAQTGLLVLVGLAVSVIAGMAVQDALGAGDPLDLANVLSGRSGLELVFAFSLIAGAAPLGEEVFFRGYVQSRLRTRMSSTAAIGISASLFALLHFHPVHVLAVLPAGLVLGYVREKTGRLAPCVALHVLNNSLAFLGATFGASSAVVALAIAVLLVATVILAIKVAPEFAPQPTATSTTTAHLPPPTTRACIAPEFDKTMFDPVPAPLKWEQRW